ncbi:hypothetical protein ATI61_113216 [Archangium gephyra]|uniref:Uncharacterized protein n=1 Tax=Archangium gephyra TaxID=48 RepID=A0AAC8TEJ2_9BACT|nr:hypothetical protein [Archangium gephyra]AKJ03030.1 Hypothetical protein AA314_04656 [Archangium gephyra]REG25152.1 hypothetical protein ATI61_113216 [Archangium gephyra]
MSATRFCTFDDSLWPLLILRIVGEPSNQQFEEYLDVSASYLRRGERHVVVADLLQAALESAEQRRRRAEWMSRHDGLTRELLLGNAFVINAPFLRLGLNLLFHVRPPPWSYLIVPRLEPALAWAAGRMDEAGLREPAERVRRHFGLWPVSQPS